MSAANKTQPTQINVTEFLATLEPARRQEDAQALLTLFESATGLAAKMWGPSIIGYGIYHYQYESGRKGEAPIVAFSPRKAQIVIYGLGNVEPENFISLGKHSRGKGCLNIKKLADVDLSALSFLIATAWQQHSDKTRDVT